ncbi:hypothetical protein LPJ59_002751 [Coemansia sp. RSA 2399]|nr:hypothetical protein LPJ59_002751 [Coemansia sp. RSA 2399]KAJ1903255.1 hypothetical protein LPJ81_003156 [Coemansia sp. IMI 209127]
MSQQQYAPTPERVSSPPQPEDRHSDRDSKQADIAAYIAASKRETEAVAKMVDEAISPLALDTREDKAAINTAAAADAVAKKQWWGMVKAPNWGRVLGFVATYMALPFVTGVMAGIGEIFANELLYKWGWRGARPISVPGRNSQIFPKPKDAQLVTNVVEKQ